MYQYLDKSCLGIGGDTDEGRFALYLGNDFYKGSSNRTRCYNNEVLSHNKDFLCVELEVWGFE